MLFYSHGNFFFNQNCVGNLGFYCFLQPMKSGRRRLTNFLKLLIWWNENKHLPPRGALCSMYCTVHCALHCTALHCALHCTALSSAVFRALCVSKAQCSARLLPLRSAGRRVIGPVKYFCSSPWEKSKDAEPYLMRINTLISYFGCLLQLTELIQASANYLPKIK